MHRSSVSHAPGLREREGRGRLEKVGEGERRFFEMRGRSIGRGRRLQAVREASPLFSRTRGAGRFREQHGRRGRPFAAQRRERRVASTACRCWPGRRSELLCEREEVGEGKVRRFWRRCEREGVREEGSKEKVRSREEGSGEGCGRLEKAIEGDGRPSKAMEAYEAFRVRGR